VLSKAESLQTESLIFTLKRVVVKGAAIGLAIVGLLTKLAGSQLNLFPPVVFNCTLVLRHTESLGEMVNTGTGLMDILIESVLVQDNAAFVVVTK